MSSSKRRREKSTVATKRSAVAGRRVDDRRASGPGTDDRDAVDAVGFEHERLHRVVVRDPVATRARDRDRAGASSPVSGANSAASRGTVPARRRSPSPRGTGTRRSSGRGRARRTRARCSPQRSVRAGIVDVRAHERRRALLVEQLARRVAQQFLVVGEREVHRVRLGGGPSTRWAMMLRWISDDPPAMVFANDEEEARAPSGRLPRRGRRR